MTASGAPAILVQGLTRWFGRRAAVSNLSLRIDRGEIFALLGPDGAGKTTTLRMLCGAVEPTSGTIVIEGTDLAKNPDLVREHLGYMPQRFSLYGDLTVQENLDFYAELFAVPRAVRERRSRQLLEFSGLGPFRRRPGAQLSGGMRQKLALACTLVHEPTVLLLDEPTAGVDPVSRREFWRILYELNRGGVTILASTTYMDEADRCTTVGLLYAGELVAAEDPGVMKRRMRGDVVEFVAEPRVAARRIIARAPEVISETMIGDRFHVVVQDAAAAVPALTQRLAAQGVQVRGATTISASLEDVFVSVIAAQRAAAATAGGAVDG